MIAEPKTANTVFSSPESRIPAEVMSRSTAYEPAPVLALRQRPLGWFQTVIEKLERLTTLEEDWDSYGAAPVSSDSIRVAIEIAGYISRIENVPEPAVGAAPNGHVGFSWDGGPWSLDAEILPEGRIKYVYLDDRESTRERDRVTDRPAEIAQLLTQWPE